MHHSPEQHATETAVHIEEILSKVKRQLVVTSLHGLNTSNPLKYLVLNTASRPTCSPKNHQDNNDFIIIGINYNNRNTNNEQTFS